MPVDLLAASPPPSPYLKLTIPTAENLANASTGKGPPKDLLAQPRVPFPDEKDTDVSGQSASRPLPAKSEDASTFQPVKDLLAYTKENYKAGQEAQASPYLTIRLLGTLGAATAPVGGAAHALISKPLERTTGIPASQSDAALMFTPAGIGGAAGMVGRAAKAVPAIGRGIAGW